MKIIKTIEHFRIRNEAPAFYIFDIWEIEVSSTFFNKIKNHPRIFICKKENSIPEPTASHVGFIFHKKGTSSPKMDSTTQVRLSFSGVARLKHKDNYILLKENGIIKPFGGAYHLTNFKFPKKITLENSPDTRMFFSAKDYLSIKNWLFDSKNVDRTIHRELFEEFVLENDIINESCFNLEFINSK